MTTHCSVSLLSSLNEEGEKKLQVKIIINVRKFSLFLNVRKISFYCNISYNLGYIKNVYIIILI